jgi:RNA polymerase sigma factor (TIGR02999 family)
LTITVTQYGTMSRRDDVTGLLLQWRQGDAAALDRLVPLVYEELKTIARARLQGERGSHTLQATALVHEAYLRLMNLDRMTLADRAHFLAVAARLMRQILVDHARKRRADKRGGDKTIIGLEGDSLPATSPGVDVLALHEALDEMASFDPRQRDLVELRFFGGLTIDEAAEALGVSPATVERQWALAKAWLYQRLATDAR